MSLHGANALSSESWEESSLYLQLNKSNSFDIEPIIFICSRCGASIDSEMAVLSDFDDSVQCPNCGNWE